MLEVGDLETNAIAEYLQLEIELQKKLTVNW
jgi:hypothetical protein